LRKRRRRGGRVAPLGLLGGFATVVLLAGCGTKTNVLNPQGPPARSIASLWWWVLGGCSFGMLFVTGLLVLAWLRRRSMGPGREPAERAGWIVIVTLGIVVMVAGMAALFVVGDIVVARGTEAPAASATTLTVRAVGYQWYWKFEYPGTSAVTADEMHIPVRTPVLVQVRSADVIHSFWVPELNRKIDVIPGQDNAEELYADKVGVYRGECNQYCGLQHAHMGFLVFVDSKASFRAWLANQSRPARPPTGALARIGEHVFMQGSCSNCHTVRGTPARGYIGPDLTHLATRTTLAGASIPNRKGYLGGWIVGSQRILPGNQMPDINLTGRQLQALLAYLQGLR
jgi:cytochrome c oxidase subunit 2